MVGGDTARMKAYAQRKVTVMQQERRKSLEGERERAHKRAANAQGSLSKMMPTNAPVCTFKFRRVRLLLPLPLLLVLPVPPAMPNFSISSSNPPLSPPPPPPLLLGLVLAFEAVFFALADPAAATAAEKGPG
jgi:hypothetical protein